MTTGRFCNLILLLLFFTTQGYAQSFEESLSAAKIGATPEVEVGQLDSLLNTVINSENYIRIGKVSYALAYRMSKHRIGSAEKLLEVIDIGRKAYKTAGYNGYHLARFQLMAGNAYESLGNPELAFQQFMSFEGIDISHYKGLESYIQAQMYIARNFRILGDFDLAETVLKRADFDIHNPSIKDGNRRFYYLEKSLVEDIKGTEEADALAVKFAQLALRYASEYEKPEVLTQLASAELKKGNFERTNTLQKQAADKAKALTDTTLLLTIYNNQSDLQYRLGDYKESVKITNEALAICRPTDASIRLRILENQISSAVALEKVGELEVDLTDQDTIQGEGHLDSRLLYHFKLASARFDKFLLTYDSTHLAKAKVQLDISDKLQDNATANLKTLTSRQEKRTDLYALYQLGLDIAAALGDAELMYYYAEKSNNHLLFQTGKEAINSYTLREKDIIRRSLATDSLDTKSLTDLADIQKEKVDRLILSEERPDLSIMPYEYLPSAIKKQSIDIFCEGREDLYRLIITNEDRTIVNCGNKKNIKKIVDQLATEVSNPPNENLNILSELQTQLKNALQISAHPLSPIVVKGQILDPIPLEVLDIDAISQICYQPSLSQTTNFYSTEPFVGNSAVFSPTYSNQRNSNTTKTASLPLGPLPHSQKEADQVGSLLAIDGITVSNAETFMQAITNSDLIHYTGHAYQDINADYSYIPMSNDVENVVYAYQIEANKSTAAMVVLNACKTNTGKVIEGEGTLSLTRSLVRSGVQSIVSTLWSVTDQSSAQILTSFYQNLKDGQSKSLALANAKKTFLATCPDYQKHPYYWAGIVLTGDDRPLVFESKLRARNQKLLLILLAIGLTLLSVSYFSRKNN